MKERPSASWPREGEPRILRTLAGPAEVPVGGTHLKASALPDSTGKHVFMLLEDLIRPEDMLASMEESLRQRGLGTAVRLQYDAGLPPDILAMLVDALTLDSEDLYEGEGFTVFSDLFQLDAAVDVPPLQGSVAADEEGRPRGFHREDERPRGPPPDPGAVRRQRGGG
jgi:hypothetical protein